MTPDKAITAIILTSPIVSNPSTDILDETIRQFRKHLPDAKIIILADGVHPEEEYMRERYEGFHKNLSARAFEWGDVSIYSYGEWLHQSGMLRKILEDGVPNQTPLIFWSEHDIPLNTEPINWQGIVDTLVDGDLGGIRFELTGDSPKLTRGFETYHGVRVQLTLQFVGWPHVFRLDYLKEFMAPYGMSKTYLECSEFDDRVESLWSRWKYGIYSPEGDTRRCYHTHGRFLKGVTQSKPYVEVNGKRRHIYGAYKPI